MWLIVNPFFERRKIFEKISKIFQFLKFIFELQRDKRNRRGVIPETANRLTLNEQIINIC